MLFLSSWNVLTIWTFSYVGATTTVVDVLKIGKRALRCDPTPPNDMIRPNIGPYVLSSMKLICGSFRPNWILPCLPLLMKCPGHLDFVIRGGYDDCGRRAQDRKEGAPLRPDSTKWHDQTKYWILCVEDREMIDHLPSVYHEICSIYVISLILLTRQLTWLTVNV